MPGVLRDAAGAERARDDDVRADGQPRVDERLLIPGRGEDAQVDANASSSATITSPRLIDAARRAALTSRKSRGLRRALRREQLEEPAADAHEQQRRADPEQRRCEEHVDRQRERRVRVRADDGGEAGTCGQPPDKPAHGERDEVEVEALPERLLRALLLAQRDRYPLRRGLRTSRGSRDDADADRPRPGRELRRRRPTSPSAARAPRRRDRRRARRTRSRSPRARAARFLEAPRARSRRSIRRSRSTAPSAAR